MGKKDITIKVRLSPDELKMIQEKMEQFGTDNMSAFIRKMAIDGYVVKLEIPELKEILSLLRYSSNNLNQLIKRVHETGRSYDADLEDIHRSFHQYRGLIYATGYRRFCSSSRICAPVASLVKYTLGFRRITAFACSLSEQTVTKMIFTFG